MSVPKGKRTPSDMEFVKISKRLQKELILWLARDFGLKGKLRTPDEFCNYYNVNLEDRELLKELFQRNNILTVKDVFDPWLIDNFKTNITNALANMVKYIDLGNEIMVRNEIDFNVRREYQNKAIAYCKHLEYSFATMKSVLKFPFKEHILELATDIRKLLSTLRGWKNEDLQRYKNVIKDKEKTDKMEKEDSLTISDNTNQFFSELTNNTIEDNFSV